MDAQLSKVKFREISPYHWRYSQLVTARKRGATNVRAAEGEEEGEGAGGGKRSCAEFPEQYIRADK